MAVLHHRHGAGHPDMGHCVHNRVVLFGGTAMKRRDKNAKDKPPPVLCEDCGTEAELIGPDTFGEEYYCPKCKQYWAGAY
jgi:hypothetical protein